MKNYFTKLDSSILIGNVLEHFDQHIYIFLAPIIGKVFFPEFEPLVQLILTYSILATSLVTRPIGVFIFGILAKDHNPILALSYSLIGVATTTISIGFIPSYETIGFVAPVILIFIRIIQGICVAGETTIAGLYILEKKSGSSAFKASYLYQTSTMLGIIIASSLSTLIISSNYNEYWRICFIFGGITGFVGYFLRKYATSKNDQNEVLWLNKTTTKKVNIITSIWNNKIGVLRVAVITGFSYMTYSIPFIVMNNFIPLVTNISIKTMMKLNTILLIFDMIMIPILGHIFSKYNHNKIMINSCVILACTIIPLWYFIEGAPLWYITFVRLWIVVLGLIFLCPLNLWCKRLFNSSEQYILVGMGSSIGTTIFGRITPAICLTLWNFTSCSMSIAFYITFITVITISAIKFR